MGEPAGAAGVDWIAIYGAGLSSLIAIASGAKFLAGKLRARQERMKLQTDLYLLRKIDRRTGETHPIVVVLLANLGNERIALKSLEYDGVSENGLPANGSMGYYEQPEELFGVRRRLLPIVLESGQTADLPMVEIGVLTRMTDLRIWLTDFEGERHYIDPKDIKKAKDDVDRFLAEPKAGRLTPG